MAAPSTTTPTAPRFGRFQKATTLLPLALLSAAVTSALVGVGPTTTSAVAEQQAAAALPDGTSVPTDAIKAPASVSKSGPPARAVSGSLGRAARTASVAGIPAAALAAYQRAETVINSADPSCRLSWQLIAAIGRVESDHGRYGGNTLDDDGVATPGIFGIALDGSRNTQVIRDTDDGQYDADAKWDRAVGPMQFIPSTWSVVGVDGDNDGKRNPQDIDDAALASAVYLCSGDDDLSRVVGQRAAIYRYNHSDDYVDLVLSFMRAYLSGDFTSVPNGVSGAGYFAPVKEPRQPQAAPGGGGGDQPQQQVTGSGGGGGGNQPSDPAEEPTGPVGPGGGGGGGGGGNGGGGGGNVPNVPDVPVVEDTLTEAEATAQCLQELGLTAGSILTPAQIVKLEQCVTDLLG